MKPAWVLHPSRNFLSLGHCWVQHTVCWRNHFYFLSREKERWHSSIWHRSIFHSKYNTCSHCFSLYQFFLCWPKEFLVSFGPRRGVTQSPPSLALSLFYPWLGICVHVCALSRFSCVQLCDPMGFPLSRDSPGKNTVWVAMPSSRGSFKPRDQTHLLHCRWVLYSLSQLGSPTCVQLAIVKGRKSWTFQESFTR